MSFRKKTKEPARSFSEVYSGEVIDITPEEYGIALYPSGTTLAVAAQLAEQDHCRALLAANALRNTLALSMAECQAVNYAPQGAERYRAIVDAYAEMAAKTIRRW